MYQFCTWCFLCANDKQVCVEIRSLDEALRENLGQFSIINYSLSGVPSKICLDCSNFLKDFESRKERYAAVEQMFMELSKARNKSTVDLAVVRRKYKLDEEQQVPEATVVETQQLIEIIEAYDDEPKAESPKQRRAVVVSRSKPSPLNTIKLESIEEIPKISVKPLKILNPTIHSKITNVNRKERFSCDKCSHTTSTKLSIERHMQLHLKPCSNLFSCSTCQKTFAKLNILKAHEKIHLIQRPTFDCPQCDKTLSSKTAVANHIRWLHKVKREFECEKCHKMFATRGSLKEHEKTHAPIKAHSCPNCHKRYKTASTLSQHMDTHDDTEYHCSVCQMRLNSRRTLKQHMLQHSDVARFSCELCSAQFKRAKAYKEHLISVHTDIKAYTCDWCPLTFSNGANCRKHKKTAHPKELAEADKKNCKKIVKLPKMKDLLSMSHESSVAK